MLFIAYSIRWNAFSPDSNHDRDYTLHTIAFKAYLSPLNNSESLIFSRNFNLKMVKTSVVQYIKFHVQSLAFHLQLIFFLHLIKIEHDHLYEEEPPWKGGKHPHIYVKLSTQWSMSITAHICPSVDLLHTIIRSSEGKKSCNYVLTMEQEYAF